MEDETAQELFRRFSLPGEKLDDDWIEAIEETITDEGEIVASHSWDSGGPGAGAGVDLIYRFRGVFLASSDLGLEGPFGSLGEAVEAVNLLSVNETTENIWVDYTSANKHGKSLSPRNRN